MVCVDVCVSRHLKEELTWAIDRQLQGISNIMSLKTKTILNLKQFCMHCYVTLSNIIIMYENMYPLFKQIAAKKAGRL